LTANALVEIVKVLTVGCESASKAAFGHAASGTRSRGVGTVRYPCTVRLDPKPHPAELIAAERYLHRRLRNRLNDATEGHGLSYAQVEVMLLLEERTNLHAGQMSRALGTSRQAVHALLEKLEGAGLVDVLPQQGEARPIALTDLGRRRIRSIWGVLDSTVHAALRQIPAAERRELLDALNRCERALAPLRPPWWLD
jgi:DNA-binding MarR family transcriptional regulator